MLIFTCSANYCVTATGHGGFITGRHPGQHFIFYLKCTQCHPITHSVSSECSDLLATYSKVGRIEAGFQNRHNEGDKETREACKIRGGQSNPSVPLHLNGKDAELGEGLKRMNIGSKGPRRFSFSICHFL